MYSTVSAGLQCYTRLLKEYRVKFSPPYPTITCAPFPLSLPLFINPVTHGGPNNEPSMYGPGSGYASLAGRPCTRALALMSTDEAVLSRGDDMSGLTPEDLKSAESWHAFLKGKYEIVGRLER